MTYVEKLRADHPEWSEFELGYKVADCCPEEFGYPENCDNDCRHCWEKEFPEHITSESPNDLVDIAKQAARVRDAFDDALGIDPSKPHILDSGDRTQFSSGAVRDMREGKGRFDICPMEIIGNYLCDDNNGTDPVIWNMAKFLNTNSTSYLYSALHHFELMCYPDPYSMFLDVAVHFEQGAKKYGEGNFKKGIPAWCYIDSATRHYIKWHRGDTNEPHARAVVWNLMCCIWELNYGEEWRNEQSLKEMVDNLSKLEVTEGCPQKALEPKSRQITISEKPYSCRLGDYTKGLFKFDDDVYAKVNTAIDCGTCVNILTGIKREFHPNLVITTVDIGEIFTKEAEDNV